MGLAPAQVPGEAKRAARAIRGTGPPLSQERLGRFHEQTLVYSLRRPTADGRTELLLTPLGLLDLLAQLVTPPRLHKHRCWGVRIYECLR